MGGGGSIMLKRGFDLEGLIHREIMIRSNCSIIASTQQSPGMKWLFSAIPIAL